MSGETIIRIAIAVYGVFGADLSGLRPLWSSNVDMHAVCKVSGEAGWWESMGC